MHDDEGRRCTVDAALLTHLSMDIPPRLSMDLFFARCWDLSGGWNLAGLVLPSHIQNRRRGASRQEPRSSFISLVLPSLYFLSTTFPPLNSHPQPPTTTTITTTRLSIHPSIRALPISPSPSYRPFCRPLELSVVVFFSPSAFFSNFPLAIQDDQ